MASCENGDRCRSNKDMLTGRWRGDYYEDGQPRGGGGRQETREVIRYVPTLVSLEQVYENMGIATDRPRTPYEELTAAVTPIKETVVVRFDPQGRPVGRESV